MAHTSGNISVTSASSVGYSPKYRIIVPISLHHPSYYHHNTSQSVSTFKRSTQFTRLTYSLSTNFLLSLSLVGTPHHTSCSVRPAQIHHSTTVSKSELFGKATTTTTRTQPTTQPATAHVIGNDCSFSLKLLGIHILHESMRSYV